LQGEEFVQTARALRAGDLESAGVTPAERKLLEFSAKLTERAWAITDGDVAELRAAGWSDAQIAEAVYVGAFFNMMVRLADAFGIEPPPEADAEGVPPAVSRGRAAPGGR
jgi:alkylhydroperoxidase family enzyme